MAAAKGTAGPRAHREGVYPLVCLVAIALCAQDLPWARRADGTRVHLIGAAGHGDHLLDHREVGVKHSETSHLRELLGPWIEVIWPVADTLEVFRCGGVLVEFQQAASLLQ